MIGPASRSALAAAVMGLAVTVAGCGSAGERRRGAPTATDEARAVVERFGRASARHDYQTICDDLLASSLINRLESVGLPCEVAFEKGLGDVRGARLAIRQVSVQGARALVSVHSTARGQVPSDDALQLVREDGQWRIASLIQPKASG